MASPTTAFPTAISSSVSLIAEASAAVPIQASISIITPQNASQLDFKGYYLQDGTYSLPAPIAGGNWTPIQAIYFGIPSFSFIGEEQGVQVLPLTPSGCFLGPGSAQTRNCSESCVQAASIFSNTSTLANCMALPLITNMIATGSLLKSSEIIANSYGIDGNRSLALRVNSTLSNCFRASCQQSMACKKNYNLTSSFWRNSSNYCEQGRIICQGMEQTVLEDIAGIGVRVMICYDLQELADVHVRSMLHIGYRAVSRFWLGYCS